VAASQPEDGDEAAAADDANKLSTFVAAAAAAFKNNVCMSADREGEGGRGTH